jgi:hypothetical protein
MKRDALIKKLENVAPALAVNQLIPLLSHFWFTGKYLMAFNDQIALAVPFRSDFKGAVSPKILELLRASSGYDELTITWEGTNLIIKDDSGATNIKMAMLEPRFVFKMPEPKEAKSRKREPVLRAVAHCLISIGTDTSSVEQLGVTIEPSDKGTLVFYSTDDHTISRAFAKVEGYAPPRSILPGLFCEQMLRLERQADEEAPEFSFEVDKREGTKDGPGPERYALYSVGEILLYGRLLETRNPLNFASIMAYNLPSNRPLGSALFDVPETFRSALERASIVCDAERKPTRITVRSGKMTLRSASEREAVEDVIKALPKLQIDVDVSIDAKLIRRGSAFEKMLITERCVIMASGNRLYLVACRHK